MFKHLAKLKTSGNFLKHTANIIFLTISCLLIASLLSQLSDEKFIQAIYIIVAIGLDIFRQYVVALAKFYWRSNLVKSCALWFVYLLHVSVVLIASIGFSLSAIDTKVKSTEVYNLQKQAIIDNVNSNEAEIKKLEPIKETLNSSSEQYRVTSQRIDALQKVDRGLFEQLKGFSAVKIDIQTDVYDTLGAALHTQGKFIKLYMLFIISALIELALLVTSWDIQLNEVSEIPGTSARVSREERKALAEVSRFQNKPLQKPPQSTGEPLRHEPRQLTDRQQELINFVDALFNNDNPNRLNGAGKIVNDTGLTFRKCKEYQDFLNSIGAIDLTPGNCKAVWSKEDIINHIKTKIA